MNPADSPVQFACGDWTAELRGDELADIGYQGVRLLRAIRVVVRDHDWRTAPPTRRLLRVGAPEGPEAVLRVGIEVGHRLDEVDFAWVGELTVEPGCLRFAVRGEAVTAFRRNRIGIVVLHPLEDAGRPFEVIDPQGGISRHRLPEQISPHQPLRDLRALRWTNRHVTAHLELTGDVFETEDQRNWTDASFKTYSTPLTEPFPVLVTPGERVEQSATLWVSSVTGDRPAAPATSEVTAAPARTADPKGAAALASSATPVARDAPVTTIAVGERPRPLPALGFGVSTAALDPAELAASIDQVTPSALLVELDLRRDAPWAQLAAAVVEAEAWAAPLDVRLVTDDPRHLLEATARLADHPVRRVGVFHPVSHVTEPELWTALCGQLHRLPDVAPVGGSRAHFTELNRTLHRLPADIPELTFSITPQMHAVERAHIVDSIAAQRLVAENAVRLAAGRPLHIGPVTLKPRFNAVATTPGLPVVPSGPELVAERTDARQPTDFAAAWTVASVAALAVEGVTSISHGETVGPRGLRATGSGPLYPVGQVARVLASLREHRPVVLDGELPAGVGILGGSDAHGAVALVVNLSRVTHRLRFARPVRISRVIPAGGPASTVGTHLDLAPEEVLRVAFDALPRTGSGHA